VELEEIAGTMTAERGTACKRCRLQKMEDSSGLAAGDAQQLSFELLRRWWSEKRLKARARHHLTTTSAPRTQLLATSDPVGAVTSAEGANGLAEPLMAASPHASLKQRAQPLTDTVSRPTSPQVAEQHTGRDEQRGL
jgi:hypothetical protein